MVARVNTVAFHGVEVVDVDAQVQMASGLPAFTVVGLPDKAVAESRERVRAALGAMGLALPPKRITVNLAPADLLKEGSHFDLPIALGLLVAMGVLPSDEIGSYSALGELALDGRISPVAGVLPAAMHALAAERGLICPAAQGGEAAWANGIEVLAPDSLLALVNHFKGRQVLNPPEPALADAQAEGPDLKDIKGQETAKRALEIAAAGGHNLLMIGPPGAGKSMLAARLPGILPPLSPAEALEVSMIHSVAGQLDGVDRALLGPAFYRDAAVAGIDADHHLARIAGTGGAHQVRVLDRGGAQDHPAHPGAEPGLDRRHVADAAAELQRQVDRRQDRFDRGPVDRASGHGAVQIDQVQPGKARLGERRGLRRRVGVKHRGGVHGATEQAHHAPVLQVDGGKQDHAAPPIRSLQ